MSGEDERSQRGFKPITHHREEEKYFYERDLELVQELRKRADEERHRVEKEQQKALHWMRCPKCGSAMEEVRFEALVLDRCESCKGAFFGHNELSIVRKLALEGEQATAEVLARLIDALEH